MSGREAKLREVLEALADKMGERCGDHCSNSCKICEYRNDLRLILARTAALAASEPTDSDTNAAYCYALREKVPVGSACSLCGVHGFWGNDYRGDGATTPDTQREGRE